MKYIKSVLICILCIVSIKFTTNKQSSFELENTKFIQKNLYYLDNECCGTSEINRIKEILKTNIQNSQKALEDIDSDSQQLSSKVILNKEAIENLNEKLPFELYIDEDGNYGYINNETKEFIPF